MKKFIYIVLLVSMIAACKKEKPACPEPLPPMPKFLWSDYIGTYDVYDTINHTQWVMNIKHLRHSKFNMGNSDSILIENFANRFTIRDTWYPFVNTRVNKSGFFVKIYHPIKDQNGYNWHLNGIGDDQNTNVAENILLGDSITLYFKQSNIAFYQNEGIPYYECDCKHIAVKRK